MLTVRAEELGVSKAVHTILTKFSHKFARRCNYRILAEEFFQEFFLRYLELKNRYTDLPQSQFIRILGASLYRRGLDLLKQEMSLIPVEEIFEEKPHLVDTYNFLFILAAESLTEKILELDLVKKMFANPEETLETIENLRKEAGMKQKRKIAKSDIVRLFQFWFNIPQVKAEAYFRRVKEFLMRQGISHGFAVI